MKAFVSALLVTCALAAPAAAFAQSAGTAANAPVTRAQVIADLTRVEHAGYRPSGDDPYYPEDIQRAESIVAQQQAQKAPQARQ